MSTDGEEHRALFSAGSLPSDVNRLCVPTGVNNWVLISLGLYPLGIFPDSLLASKETFQPV